MGYKFTSFATAIIAARYLWERKTRSFECFDFSTYEDITRFARTATGKKRWIFIGVLLRSEAVRTG